MPIGLINVRNTFKYNNKSCIFNYLVNCIIVYLDEIINFS